MIELAATLCLPDAGGRYGRELPPAALVRRGLVERYGKQSWCRLSPASGRANLPAVKAEGPRCSVARGAARLQAIMVEW